MDRRAGAVLERTPLTGVVAQHELLLRMLGDDGELISPGSFLPLAERVGLAPEIDRWVAAKAIELLASDPGGHVALEVTCSRRR